MFTPVRIIGELHAVGGDGAVYYGDVRELGSALLYDYRQKARVVYIDPPFNTGGSFEYRRGARRLAYVDSMPKYEYLAFMRGAAELSRELLREDGTFFIHIDCRMSAYIRVMLDEVFGEDAFTNEIVWTYRSGGRTKNSFSNKHDVILMYRRSPSAYFDISAVGVPRGAKRKNHMKRGVDESGRVFFSIRTNGKEYRYYEDDRVFPSDVWDDLEHLNQRDPERTGFLTQKPEALLRRIILSCSEPSDTVIDLFGGSGTTAFTAAKLGRSFVTSDNSPVALAIIRRRLLERGFKLSLYEDACPLSFKYSCAADAKMPELDKYFLIGQEDGRLVLKLKRLSEEEIPYYLAYGLEKGGVFHAQGYVTHPTAGKSVRLAKGQTLHLVDGEFEQYFIRYDG